MIIEPRIEISDEEFVALKNDSMDFEVAVGILSRLRGALRGDSFNVVQIAIDHEADLADELNNLASELKMFVRDLDRLAAAGAIPKEVPNRLREILETNGH